MNSVLIDGKVIGDIVVSRLCLRGQASVFGSITCKSLQIDPTVIIVGNLNVHPNAPKVIDSEGKILPENTAVTASAGSNSNVGSGPGGNRKSSVAASSSSSSGNNSTNPVSLFF